MNGFDVAASSILLVAFLVGLVLGIVRMALGATSLLVGGFAAMLFAQQAAAYLTPWVPSPRLALLVGFIGVYLLVLTGFAIVAWLARKSLSELGLRWIDRLAGAAIGLVVLLVAVAAMAIGLEDNYPENAIVSDSIMVAPLARGARWGRERLPSDWQALLATLLEPARDAAGAVAAGASGDGVEETRGESRHVTQRETR